MLKLDLGCGKTTREGFAGVDLHKSEGDWDNVDYEVDIEQEGLPFTDRSIEEIWSGHFFEHLTKNKVPNVFAECFRVLIPGGRMTIIVPDLLKVMQNFLDAPLERKDGWQIDTIFGGQAHEGEYHKTGYWPEKLIILFGESGFSQIEITEVEGWGQPCLQAEGMKP